MTGCVERLHLQVWLDDSGAGLAWAREAVDGGDASWKQWLADYASGAALIVCLRLSARCTDAHGLERVAESVTSGEWIEWSPHIASMEAQLQELAKSNVGSLARELRAVGIEIPAAELADMAIHVDLDDALHDRLIALRDRPGRPCQAP